MKRFDRQDGFTLLEMGLALTIGLIIAAAAVTFYRQAKDDAGDALMRQKITSLQGVVENLYTATGSTPALSEVQKAWQSKRPDDYLTSPWGGTILDGTNTPGGPYGVTGITGTSADYATSSDPTVYANYGLFNMGPGGLYYYRIMDGPVGSPYPNMQATNSVADQIKQAYVTVKGYAVAGGKGRAKHFMVTSGR